MHDSLTLVERTITTTKTAFVLSVITVDRFELRDEGVTERIEKLTQQIDEIIFDINNPTREPNANVTGESH